MLVQISMSHQMLTGSNKLSFCRSQPQKLKTLRTFQPSYYGTCKENHNNCEKEKVIK
jgi:hypothetical protein